MRAFLSAIISLLILQTVYAQTAHLTLNDQSSGRTFEGIGEVSGGGAIARLLINYPEPQRSQILDLLFKPNYGASLQMLKVEVGGDGNSTEGAEPSHMHRAGDEDYNRGVEWWMMTQAKRRNPDIRLMALAWDYPGWLKDVNSREAAEYLASFILGAKRVHHLDIDDIGLWNETPTSTVFIKTLRKTLDAHGLKTRVVADDCVNNWDTAKRVQQDPELSAALGVVNTHYPRFKSTKEAKECGKSIWSGEDGPWNDTWGATGPQGKPYAELLNRNYIDGRMTASVLWCLTTSYYDILDLPNAGLLRAATPWSGHFEVMSPLWIVAHTTQFVHPGWKYIDNACGHLSGGGSYVSLHQGSDYSIIIETLAAKSAQPIDWNVTGALSPADVHVWRSDRKTQFVELDPIHGSNGKFSIAIDPDCVYSITTTTGQHKGGASPAPDADFPLPYHDDFEKYDIGCTTPNYYIEQNGSYEIVNAAAGHTGRALRQVVNQPPIPWLSGKNADLLGTASIIGNKNWRNYRVATDIYLEEPGYARVMGRISHCSVDGKIDAYQLCLFDSGKWELRFAAKDGVLASGQVQPSLKIWRKLELAFHDDSIAGSIDGVEVTRVKDGRFTSGMAGLGNGFNVGQYDNLSIEPEPASAAKAVQR